MPTKIEQPIRTAMKHGRAWTMPIDAVDPTGADDIFAAIAPTAGRPIDVVAVNISSSVVGDIEPFVGTGSPTGVTDVPCRNLGGGEIQPKATKGTGVDITTIPVSGGKLNHFFITTANVDYQLPLPPEGVRVLIGETFGLNWEPATGILSGSITFFEIDEEDM